jgi:vacuolar-type H+-ATPase subunit H
VFLYCSAIFVEGTVTETGPAYAIENEEWLGLSKGTTVFVMEEGAMKGICKRKMDEEQRANRARGEARKVRVTLEQSAYQAQQEAVEAKRNKPWKKLLRKLRREPETRDGAMRNAIRGQPE